MTHQGVSQRTLPGVETVFAVLNLSKGRRDMAQIFPERRFHRNWEQQPTTGVVVHTTWPWLDDVYVLLTGWDEKGGATYRIIINPLVSLLWIGSGIFLLGTAAVIWPETTGQRAAVPRLSREVVASEA